MIIIKAGSLDRYLELKNRKNDIIQRVNKINESDFNHIETIFSEVRKDLLRLDLVNVQKELLDLSFEVADEQNYQQDSQDIDSDEVIRTKKF